MTDAPQIQTTGEIIASSVRYEDFLNGFEGMRVEWVNGEVILMPGIDERHDGLTRFVDNLFQAYLEVKGGGRVLQDPMLMHFLTYSRAPDIQVLLPESLHKLQPKEVLGAADLVVEIVSQGSQRIDRVEKYDEYERGGVQEYWIIDPIYAEALFFQRGEDHFFERVAPDEHGVYHSKVLSNLRLPVTLLWQDPLPAMREIIALVDDMVRTQP